MQKRTYEALPIPCDVTSITLQEAAMRVGPAFIYELYVHPVYTASVRGLIRKIMADVVDNPMAPHINLHLDNLLDRDEWVLEANGKGCGSNPKW